MWGQYRIPHSSPVFPKTLESVGRNIHCLCLVLVLAFRFLNSFKYILDLFSASQSTKANWMAELVRTKVTRLSCPQHSPHFVWFDPPIFMADPSVHHAFLTECMVGLEAQTGRELASVVIAFWGHRVLSVERAVPAGFPNPCSPTLLVLMLYAWPWKEATPRCQDGPFHRGMWKATLGEGDFKATSEECCHRGECRKDAKFTCWLMVRNTCWHSDLH